SRGGTVNLGGGFQGQGPLPTSQQTVVGPNATISADATVAGDGGTIIAWSDELTRFYGNASAQGGAISGDGGLVEVSGLQQLVFEGAVDTTATNGAVGTLLLDPTNIRVVDFLAAETFSLADVDEFADADIGGDGDTRIASLALSFATNNVVLQASEAISFEAAVDIQEPFVGLEAVAGERIVVNQPITTDTGDVFLNAQDLTIRASISSLGGDITLLGDNSVSLENEAIVESGDFDFEQADTGAILVRTTGLLSLIEGSQIRATAFGDGNGANIEVFADSISVDGFSLFGGPSSIAAEVAVGSVGFGGNLTVEASNIRVSNGATISTSTFDEGTAGDLQIMTDNLEVDGFAEAGGILLGPSGVGSQVFFSGTGGDVTVEATHITVTNGATISTTTFDEGTAGNVVLIADTIDINGFASDDAGVLVPSNIASDVGGASVGGDVIVTTNALLIANGGQLSTSNVGDGIAGDLRVTANQISLDGAIPVGGTALSPSAIVSQVLDSGPGGDVIVEANDISITNSAVISTSNAGTGPAGNLWVTADQIELETEIWLYAPAVKNFIKLTQNQGDFRYVEELIEYSK
ncbi:MAG: hypothetical protein F6K42_36250, partial [Leptolyngbya sp. SIO1D8]|nr:hypothetical protein [Leptolyngbya sp. SIO1D8]